MPTSPALRVLRPSHAEIVYLLAAHGPLTDPQIERRFAPHAATRKDPWPWQAPSGLRARRSELVSWGMVTRQSRDGKSPTRRPASVWALAEPMPLAFTGLVFDSDAVADLLLRRLWTLAEEAGGDLVIRTALADVAKLAGVEL
jgi:hypothetical protein